MAHRLLRDTEADGWERSDFPIICESCLGDNPYVRMTKANFDKECKICTRPFTVFRWRPGRDARYKKTEICQTCCKLKNVCQVCLLDLEYGLPVQVRDTALSISTTDAIPKSDVNREYYAEEHDRKARAGIDFDSAYGNSKPTETILKLQRTAPYYKRNRAHICSFYIRGQCTRGAECPYRHEMPVTGELANQNIKDRYYGVNDPVAMKLLAKAGDMPTLEPPSDLTVRTLYIGGVDETITEDDLRDQFYPYGELESVRVLCAKSCAFVAYSTREGAEKAAEELANRLVVRGARLKLMWGRPPAARLEGGSAPPPPGTELAEAPEPQLYPSMNPERMGSRLPGKPKGEEAGGDPEPSAGDAQSGAVPAYRGPVPAGGPPPVPNYGQRLPLGPPPPPPVFSRPPPQGSGSGV